MPGRALTGGGIGKEATAKLILDIPLSLREALMDEALLTKCPSDRIVRRAVRTEIHRLRTERARKARHREAGSPAVQGKDAVELAIQTGTVPLAPPPSSAGENP